MTSYASRAISARSRSVSIQWTAIPRGLGPFAGSWRGRLRRCPSRRPHSRSRRDGSRCVRFRTPRPGPARAGRRSTQAASRALGCVRAAYSPEAYRTFQRSRSASLIAVGPAVRTVRTGGPACVRIGVRSRQCAGRVTRRRNPTSHPTTPWLHVGLRCASPTCRAVPTVRGAGRIVPGAEEDARTGRQAPGPGRITLAGL